ncbi:hypothetical protein MMON_58720 [Mycolicibacterium monacense]|uniref:Aldehyde dehydrogenase domain-containing protein n=1 Tax=Mycolicibacterium monacense TaxID=85693 RepID=A0AAD1J0Y4_MYCMB|nr:hypothetical protein MMON_58720 [Mycolicibacterium monacense]
MELGGNAPFIVFDDADIDAAVDGAMLAKMRNGGEACTAANRFHVANSVREEFTEKLVKRMSEVTLGNGLDESATLGPLINNKQLQKVTELVSDAVSRGATVAVGGVAPGGPGNFYPATVLADVPADAILKEEVFGPVAPITGFDSRRRRASPTTPNTGWPPTCTPGRWTVRCASPRPSNPGWSASTAA